MLKNYFKVAFRSLLRNKVFSFINISGLAIGMASSILILLWIQNEISYDRFHAKQDRLFEVWGNNIIDGALQSGNNTPQLMGPALKKDYPEIEDAARISWNSKILFNYNDKILKADGAWTDPSFLTMFSFPLAEGNQQTALNDPHAVVITQNMAKKLFGSEEPIGKIIKVDNSENFTVTGVLKNPPNNTDFNFEYLFSSELLRSKGYFDADWTDVSIRTFVLLKPNTSLADINSKIKDIVIKYSDKRAKTTSFLYPVSQLRLYSDFENGKPVGGRIGTVRIFAIIAIFILLIACINFMNLSTARSEKRAKEVGIRKVVGALKKSLIGQFLGESILIALIAGIIAILIVQLCLPAFNNLTKKELFINYYDIRFWLAGICFILFTGVLAGSYPAFFLSAFKPVAILKGAFKKINALVTPRKLLVILQFTFAIILIICTIIVEKQIKYAQGRKSGYNKNNLIYVSLEGDIYKNYPLIKNDLLNAGVATEISQTLSPLTQVWSAGFSLSWQGKNPNAPVLFIRTSTDGNIVNTAGLHLVSGRDIDIKNYPTDSVGCIINEAAAKVMAFKNPIGQTIFDDPTTWHIVGVVKDFIVESPYQPIRPIIIKGPRSNRNVMNIKLNEKNNTAQNLAKAEKIFKKYNPAYPFEYNFMDEEYANKFNDEQLIGKLAALFAGLTICISCLGLFGLATFMAESRIKEIGIRKVLGASATNITALLSKDFVKLVIISVAIASPIAYWASNKWLMTFDYRIAISAWIFITAGLIAVAIALITISYQSIRAAMANPVNSLRSE